MVAKNLIFCFDGTNNHPRDAKQEREWFGLGDIEDNGITNILKLHVLFGGNLSNDASTAKQHSHYYSGVGTYGNRIQQLFNAAFAPRNLDVGDIIKRAGKDLRNLYEVGDQVFVFGFSRGAAIARRFAAVIDDYLPEGADAAGVVRFMGVFDTVASIGFPNLDDETRPVSDVVFEDGNVSRHVAEALHLLALDDKRTAFFPTLMNRDERVSEVWFPGAHSDVGGGFWYDGLSDIALQYLIDELASRKLKLKVLDSKKVKYEQLVAPNGDYRIDRDDVFLKPNHKGKLHQQDRWWPIAKTTLSSRRLRVNENDRPVDGACPTVHHSVIDRIRDIVEYRPKAMKGAPHQVLLKDGSFKPHQGVIDHIA